MKKAGWILLAAAMVALGGCVVVGDGARETRTYNFAGFDSVSATSGVNVVLKQGPFAISAEGPKNKLDRLLVDKDGSTLRISNKPHMDWGIVWTGSTVVTVMAPDYSGIEASGGADVDIDPLKAKALSINAHGGADVNAAMLTLDALDVKATGGADVNVKSAMLDRFTASADSGADLSIAGACKTLTVESSGGADFNGGGLKCESATVTASGGADADVTATASASGRASGGADIRFHGNPANLQKEESGGGDVSSGL